MRHCLVVDDSDVIRKVARRILESMSFEISEAENGQKALECCRERMPDAIMLDWQMPVMGGLEFISALRHTPGGSKPKIVYCTTENDPMEIMKVIKIGADHHLMKPFDRKAIEEKMIEAGFG